MTATAERNIDIREAIAPDDVSAVKSLFLEYADFLGVSLCFQGFDEEMATFPAAYELLLLAHVDGEAAAAVGLKDLGDGVCEMKRLYARPEYHGLGIGKQLCEMLISEARKRRFNAMRLDTLERLETALGMYRRFGFQEIGEYCENPEADVIYMELKL